jgi:hypothetical protein
MRHRLLQKTGARTTAAAAQASGSRATLRSSGIRVVDHPSQMVSSEMATCIHGVPAGDATLEVYETKISAPG